MSCQQRNQSITRSLVDLSFWYRIPGRPRLPLIDLALLVDFSPAHSEAKVYLHSDRPLAHRPSLKELLGDHAKLVLIVLLEDLVLL